MIIPDCESNIFKTSVIIQSVQCKNVINSFKTMIKISIDDSRMFDKLRLNSTKESSVS